MTSASPIASRRSFGGWRKRLGWRHRRERSWLGSRSASWLRRTQPDRSRCHRRQSRMPSPTIKFLTRLGSAPSASQAYPQFPHAAEVPRKGSSSSTRHWRGGSGDLSPPASGGRGPELDAGRRDPLRVESARDVSSAFEVLRRVAPWRAPQTARPAAGVPREPVCGRWLHRVPGDDVLRPGVTVSFHSSGRTGSPAASSTMKKKPCRCSGCDQAVELVTVQTCVSPRLASIGFAFQEGT